MQRLTFLLLIVSLTTTVFGQQYMTVDVKAKADSIIKSYIGDTLFDKYSDHNAYYGYKYKNAFGKSKYASLNESAKTKGKFVDLDMRYKLIIPYTLCPEHDTIEGEAMFHLDSLLRLKQKPYLDFIPDIYWTGDSCRLINKDEALIIAKQQKWKPGLDSLRAWFYYDTKRKKFIWQVSQTLSESDDKRQSVDEYVEINAMTSKVETHDTWYVGPACLMPLTTKQNKRTKK